MSTDARVQEHRISDTILSRSRRTPKLPTLPIADVRTCSCINPTFPSYAPNGDRARHPGGRLNGRSRQLPSLLIQGRAPKLTEALIQINTEQFPRIDGQAESVFRQGTQTLLQFIGEKPAQLIAQNRENVVFEAGTMTLRGREDIPAGKYVSLRLGTNGGSRSGFMQQAYAYSVTHEFLPYRSFTTAVQFDRGTGFIARAQRQGGADRSYFSDLSPVGVY
jgi:hypothetical protein